MPQIRDWAAARRAGLRRDYERDLATAGQPGRALRHCEELRELLDAEVGSAAQTAALCARLRGVARLPGLRRPRSSRISRSPLRFPRRRA